MPPSKVNTLLFHPVLVAHALCVTNATFSLRQPGALVQQFICHYDTAVAKPPDGRTCLIPMLLFPELIPFLIAAMAALLIGIGKTGVPSLSLLFNALMVLALPTKEAIGMVLLLLVVGDVFAVLFYRKHADWAVLLRLLPTIVLGLLAGTFILDQIPNDLIKPVIAGVILSMFCLDQALKRGLIKFDRGHPGLARVFGSLVGVTTVVGNSAGPVSAMYFMLLQFDKYRFMGTSAWLFCVVNLSKVPLLWSIDVVGPNTFYSLLFLMPFVFLGAFIGRRILGVIPERFFSALVMISVLGTSTYFLLGYFVLRHLS